MAPTCQDLGLSEERGEIEKVNAFKRLLETTEVDAKLRRGGEGGLDDLTCVRWLRAHRWKVNKAAEALTRHADWRLEIAPTGAVAEADIASDLSALKSFQQGCDKHGRPVTIVDVGKHRPRAGQSLWGTTKYITYAIDVAFAHVDFSRNPAGLCGNIFDMSGYTMANADLNSMRAVFDLLQNHYPERLGYLYIYEAPTIFWALWKLVCPFIDPVTKKKIEFVYGEEAAKVFRERIDVEALPRKYGGIGSFVPVQEAAAALAKAPKTVEPGAPVAGGVPLTQ